MHQRQLIRITDSVRLQKALAELQRQDPVSGNPGTGRDPCVRAVHDPSYQVPPKLKKGGGYAI